MTDIYVTGLWGVGTGTLGGLVGSYTRLVIYATLATYCTCALEVPPFICASASIHARTLININASKPLHLFLNPVFMLVTLSPQVFQCALIPES